MTREEYRRQYAREAMRKQREKKARMAASSRDMARIKIASEQLARKYAENGVKLTPADALHLLFLSWDAAA